MALKILQSLPSVGPGGLRIAPGALAPGRADGKAVLGGAGLDERLERDEMDAAARRDPVDAGEAAGVAGVAAAGDEQQAAGGAPAVSWARADGLGGDADGVDSCIRAPVGGAADVVVAVVGGGARVDPPTGPDADLEALPILGGTFGTWGTGWAIRGSRVSEIAPSA